MANFFYTAKSIDGEIKTGNSEASDVRELARTLRQDGLILVKVESELDKQSRGLNLGVFSRKVPISEKLLMTRNLWIMVSTGLSLVKGFAILSAQSKNKKMKSALLDISQEISKGKGLADSFKKHSDIFSELFLGMIQAGEESGTLEDVLQVLSLQLEKEKEIGSKVQKALIYPIILIVTMGIVAVCLSIFVLPKLNSFFQGLHANLPLTTRMILGSGDFILKYWYFLLAGFLAVVFVSISLVKTKFGKKIIDAASLKLPVVSSLTKKNNSAMIIRSLSSLLAAGVSLTRSLEITSGTVSNFYFKQALLDACKDIQKGEKLFTSLIPNKKIFPYGALEIIEIGEETGKTSLILKKLAEFYEDEVLSAAENLSVVIEPVLIVIIGVAVGIFAVSIMGPLYSVLGNI